MKKQQGYAMENFETYLPLLFSIAYRMTGSASQFHWKKETICDAQKSFAP